jgi:beta-N-acetylhexosaminidase
MQTFHRRLLIPWLLAAPAPALAQTPGIPPLDSAGAAHVAALLETLTVEEKAAQLVMPWLSGARVPDSEPAMRRMIRWVDSLGVGGIVVSIGRPRDIAERLNDLQQRARVPLLIAADLEGGTAFRFQGGTAFPTNMGVGATGRDADAWAMGRVIALEGRAAGIHITFSPVADVNNNPDNPIINTRAFGGDPGQVARMVAASVRGTQEHGMFATAKHFPGHGDTGVDSHMALPVVEADWRRLDSLELTPFRAAIEAGVELVMSAHVAMPGVDSGLTRPATMAPNVLTGILRDSLGFRGTIVTDALNMGGVVQGYGQDDAAVQALRAGADILLMPTDPVAAVRAVARAVHDGRVTRERLDESVARVLALKARSGLFENRLVAVDSVDARIGTPEAVEAARIASAGSLVLLRDSAGVLDALADGPRRVVLVTYGEANAATVGGTLASGLRARGHTVSVVRLSPASTRAGYDSARAAMRAGQIALFAVSVRAREGRGTIDMPPALAQLISLRDRPVALVSFGSPYLVRQVPDVPAYLLAWTANALTEGAVARALTGDAAITGRLPVDIPPHFSIGDGLPRAARLSHLDWVPAALAVDTAVWRGAAPGAVLGVSVRGVRYLHGTGRMALDDPREPGPATIWDMASVTKVVALTTGLMLARDRGLVDLDAPVARYVPSFAGPGKDRVTVRHLLTHSSGLPAHRRLWELAPDRDAALALVDTVSLDAPPGTRTVYSDLGAIVLTRVLETVTGEPFDAWAARHIFTPLGMRDAGFRPPAERLDRIAPTERDPWRGRIVHGEVHDENAAWLGGVSGHAGLFGTAEDLLAFGEWLVAGSGPVTVSPAVLNEFLRRQDLVRGSSRALGWDTPSRNSSAGRWLSSGSVGHTGFTGTSLWVDRDRQLVVVLLSNRVHPTRENTAWLGVRSRVAERVVEAVERLTPGGGIPYL